MEIHSARIRHCLLYEFQQYKNASEAQRTICATYGDSDIDESTFCRWFRKFKNGDFDLSDKPRSERPPTISNTELQELLDEDSAQHNNLQRN